METKLNKFIFIILLINYSYTIFSQEKLYMKDVSINDIKMRDALFDYSTIFKCKTKEDKTAWDDEAEMNIRRVILDCDSLNISFNTDEFKKQLFTYYIKIFSSNYVVKLNEKEFKTYMKIEKIGNIFPEIQEEYENYIRQNEKNYFRPAYFGIPLLIENTEDNIVPFYDCRGLVFQIKEGIVISILIDFRTDGDFN